MPNAIRTLFRSITLPLVILQRFYFSRNSVLASSGWLKSYVSRKPLDAEGQPVPWMNYAAIDFLKKRLDNSMDLFEWGSGYSTLFFSARANTVTSIEYDAGWFELIKDKAPANATIVHEDYRQSGYVDALASTGRKFHIIVVDGRERVNCVSQCFEHLHDDGVIILDDSSREKYQGAFDKAATNGFKHIDLIGLKPRSHRTHQTTLFHKTKNCLGILFGSK